MKQPHHHSGESLHHAHGQAAHSQVPPGSILRMSAGGRLVAALAASAFLWLAVLWAMDSL